MASLHNLEKTCQEHSTPVKGGLRTIPFIIANEVLEKVSSEGVLTNMIIYLTQEYHMKSATAASILFTWGAVANILPMLGAFLSDSYLGRFRMIALASISCLIGATLVWLTALLPGAKPPTCKLASPENCQAAEVTGSQLTLLFTSFAFIAMGSAGVRPCSIAFGADQFNVQNTPRVEKTLQVYFNWYYASVGISFVFSSTIIVYIQDRMGWKVGFGVPVVLMLLSTSSFLLGSHLYIKLRSHKSLLTGFAQVVVATIRNRKHRLSRESLLVVQYHHEASSNLMVPSNKLRFLNKACVLKNPDEELRADGTASDPWRLCTVEQVEDLKSVISVMPLWSTSVMVYLVVAQSFPVLQAKAMDRHIGADFQVPPASLGVFMLLTLSLWSGCYDRFIFPLLVKITGKPTGLSLKQRMGIGILLAALATAASALVEAARRKTATEEGLPGEPAAVVSMSAMWLVLPYSITGLAEAFMVIAQVEFFYSELPESMSSFAVALVSLGFAAANLVGTSMVKLIGAMTERGGRESWLVSDLNRGHYEYYYIILTLMSVGNFFYFLLCAWPCGEAGKKKPWETDGHVEEVP